MNPDTIKGLQHAIQIIENGIPKAKKQLAQSEQKLANLSTSPRWKKLSKIEKDRAMREAKAEVEMDKQSLINAQTVLRNLKTRGNHDGNSKNYIHRGASNDFPTRKATR
jgi:hypothetical protein